jgi:hypothetical protein
VAPLPHIPERHLLTALLELEADLPAIAARTKTPIDDLTRWAHTPAVYAWLDAFRYIQSIARENREVDRTTRTLDSLEKLHATTEIPVQKRLILSAILRASAAILNTTRRAPSQKVAAGRQAHADPEDAHDPAQAPAESNPSRTVTNRKLATPQTPAPRAPAFEAPPNADACSAPAPTTPSPAQPAPSPFSHLPPLNLPIPDINTLDFLPLPKRTTRSPAHLLAAAGLPAP